MLAWLLALAVAFLPVSFVFGQDEDGEGGDGRQMSEDGEEAGGRQDGGDQGGGDQGDYYQGGDDYSSSSGDGETSVNIVGDIAADDGAEEAPAPRKAARKPAVSTKKPAAVKPAAVKADAVKAAKGRVSRRRKVVSSPVGAPTSPKAEAEPQFPALDLPDLKEAVAKKEPPPPTAPLVPLPLAFP